MSIADWDETRLVNFINDLLLNHPVTLGKTIAEDLQTPNDPVFSSHGPTVGAAGAASALPATPELYVKVTDPFGKTRLIPLYKTP